MNNELYQQLTIREREQIYLMALRENCDMLEDQVHELSRRLADDDRQILEAYIDMRNELELETVKKALGSMRQY